jgi:hypothetical protein
MDNWTNSFASINNGNIMQSSNIDDLFQVKSKDFNVIKMLELKGEILSLIDGRDDFELTEEEINELNNVKESDEFKKEIDDFISKIKKYINRFNKVQLDLYKANDDFQKEVHLLRKNISTTESMVEFIEKIPDEQKNQENIKNIIEQMNILTKTIMDNKKIKQIRENYLEKRKETEKMIQFIKKINNLNQTNICSLCFSNTVDHFLDPCGHTFCKDCIKTHIGRDQEIDLYEIDRIDNSQCCFCRQRIKTVRQLYFL